MESIRCIFKHYKYRNQQQPRMFDLPARKCVLLNSNNVFKSLDKKPIIKKQSD